MGSHRTARRSAAGGCGMVFASTIFLFLFLPLVLALHAASRNGRYRNSLLLLASLVFYTWGEARYVLVVVVLVLLNFALAQVVEHFRDPGWRRATVALGVAANLALLGYFKYANF